jgi:hypothetical protein
MKCRDIGRYIENAAAGEISPDANKLDVKSSFSEFSGNKFLN